MHPDRPVIHVVRVIASAGRITFATPENHAEYRSNRSAGSVVALKELLVIVAYVKDLIEHKKTVRLERFIVYRSACYLLCPFPEEGRIIISIIQSLWTIHAVNIYAIFETQNFIMPAFFTPAFTDFFKKLEKNNTKEWFDSHKTNFENANCLKRKKHISVQTVIPLNAM